MNHVHVITGGGSGIGLAIAKAFPQGTVVLTGRTESRLEKACAELGALGVTAAYKTCDVTKPEQVADLMAYSQSLGEIKTVINAAGVSGTGGDPHLTLNIDLVGTANILEAAYQAASPGMVVILIASIMGYTIPPNPAVDGFLTNPLQDGAVETIIQAANSDADKIYDFSKRGVQLMAKDQAMRFGQKGARLVSLSPGIILTEMSIKAIEEHPEQMDYMKSITPVGRNGLPEEIANVAAFLASDQASFISGTDILVDGGLISVMLKPQA